MAKKIPVITIPSNRIYLDTLGEEALDALLLTRYAYSRAKEWLYNRKYEEKLLGQKQENDTEGLKRWMREKLCLVPQDYYVTSLQSHAEGMARSQAELQKVRDEEYTARCETREKKLASLQRRLTMCTKAKDSLIRRSKSLRNGGDMTSLYVPKEFRRHLPETKEYDSSAVYAYELWINGETRRIRAAMAQIREKARLDEQEQKKPLPRATFCGKAFYRLKDTTDADMEEWHRIREDGRNGMILFSGRYNSPTKNWLVRYDYETGDMDITMMDNRVIVLKDVRFPYRGEELRRVLSHRKEPGWSVGYWMDFRKDRDGREYIIMKASFTARSDGRVNTFTGDGVIAVDLNLDNIAWSELDGEGHLIHCGCIRFSLEGKTSSQINDILGRACSRIIYRCVSAKKPLVMEKIDLIKKSASLAYGNKKANRGTRLFAYRKMSALLKGKAIRESIGVIEINPAYTSFFGKIKYMKHMRSEIHVAASYVIGRRGMGYKEHVPAYLMKVLTKTTKRRHHWRQASYLYKQTKQIPAKTFRSPLPEMKKKEDLDPYKKEFPGSGTKDNKQK